MPEEPTVLDFVKSLLTPWKGKPLKIPREPETLARVTASVEADLAPEEKWTDQAARASAEQEAPEAFSMHPIQEEGELVDWTRSLDDREKFPETSRLPKTVEQYLPAEPKTLFTSQQTESPRITKAKALTQPAGPFPWRSLLALGVALLAQRSFEPVAGRKVEIGVIFYLVAAALLVWASWRGEWLPAKSEPDEHQAGSHVVKRITVVIGIFMGLVGIVLFGNNLFTRLNLSWQIIALALIIYGFWQPRPHSENHPWRERLRQFIDSGTGRSDRSWNIPFSSWTILLLLLTALVAFFRFSQLDTVPPEMTDDHAEKILDITRVLQGQTNIFFPNNGGREGLEMYLVAALQKLTGHDLNFMLLKIATALVGFLTLPFIYLIGKEIGNRRVGLLAFAFAGVSYWGNLVSRVGLRLPFYFLFTATTLYFLLRGLRTLHRNDFILAGLSLGLSMYGYTADRILPLVVLLGIGLFLIHRQATGQRRQVIFVTIMLILIALVVFIPLLRYLLDEPNGFLERTLTRMGSAEHVLPGPAWKIFLQNLWRAVIMFSWGDGEVWLVSVTHRPALDVVTGALFWMGVVLLFVRYLRQRHWRDIFLILSIPVLMLPSILSLAFPNENPNLYRTGGAFIPVFLIIALALDGFMRAFGTRIQRPIGLTLAWGLALFLFAFSAIQSHDLVFNQWYKEYRESSWNTTEMAQVIQSFAGSVGSLDTAWLVGYPYWAGSRVLGIATGYPTKDYAIWTDQLETTLADPRPKLFLLSPQDQADVDKLYQLYPKGWLNLYKSRVLNKDFIMFFVPPTPGDS